MFEAVKKRIEDGNYFDYDNNFKCRIQLSFRLEWTYKAENYKNHKHLGVNIIHFVGVYVLKGHSNDT